MIEDGCAGAPIPLPNVDTKTLVKVVEYWKKHVEMGKLAGDSNGDEDRKCVADALKTWDAEFVNVDRATLYDLVLVINRLFFLLFFFFSSCIWPWFWCVREVWIFTREWFIYLLCSGD